jgi:hypothetical protein
METKNYFYALNEEYKDYIEKNELLSKDDMIF